MLSARRRVVPDMINIAVMFEKFSVIMLLAATIAFCCKMQRRFTSPTSFCQANGVAELLSNSIQLFENRILQRFMRTSGAHNLLPGMSCRCRKQTGACGLKRRTMHRNRQSCYRWKVAWSGGFGEIGLPGCEAAILGPQRSTVRCGAIEQANFVMATQSLSAEGNHENTGLCGRSKCAPAVAVNASVLHVPKVNGIDHLMTTGRFR